jgi:hypothetical protein
MVLSVLLEWWLARLLGKGGDGPFHLVFDDHGVNELDHRFLVFGVKLFKGVLTKYSSALILLDFFTIKSHAETR